MGRYNQFFVDTVCPQCGATVELNFQGDIGHLQWDLFRIGDKISDAEPYMRPKRIGPTAEAFASGRNYWAAGLAGCPQCKSEIYAKLFIRGGVFEGIEIIEPAELEIISPGLPWRAWQYEEPDGQSPGDATDA
jgi:hypothetical protein